MMPMIFLYGFNLILCLSADRLHRCYEREISELNCYFDTIRGVEETYWLWCAVHERFKSRKYVFDEDGSIYIASMMNRSEIIHNRN